MADIAFLLLIFFLVTTQMNADKGLLRALPPEPPKDIIPPKVHERDVFIILVNDNDDLMVEKNFINIADLRRKTKEFLRPNCSNPEAPVCKPDTLVMVPGKGKTKVTRTKAVVSIQNGKSTSYDMYIQVTNEVLAAYNELRDEIAMEWYGKPFTDLSDDQKFPIQKFAYPQRISEAEPKEVIQMNPEG